MTFSKYNIFGGNFSKLLNSKYTYNGVRIYFISINESVKKTHENNYNIVVTITKFTCDWYNQPGMYIGIEETGKS